MSSVNVIVPWLVLAFLPSAKAIEIEFNFTFDEAAPTPFFSDANDPLMNEKRAALEAAASFFEGLLVDDLDAIRKRISPTEDDRALLGGSSKNNLQCPTNTWTLTPVNPSTGENDKVVDLSVPENTIVVYVGARDLPDDQFEMTENVGMRVCGTDEWGQVVHTRGELNTQGSEATDFGPWGGVIAFDIADQGGNARSWNFSVDDGPAEDQTDFLSVAMHQLGHVLGIGTSESWVRHWGDVRNRSFTGPASVVVFNGETVPLDPWLYHWAEGTESTIYPHGEPQIAAMVPGLPVGTRRPFTDLDVAALDDIGWEIAAVDEPELQAGDADMDLDFDQLDIVRVQIAAKYLTGQPATWGEGDWDGAPGGAPGDPPAGNGLFDQLDIVAALTPSHYLSGPYASVSPEDGLEHAWTVAGDNHLTNVSIPEPSTIVLALLAALALGGTCRPHFVAEFAGILALRS